MQQKQRQGFTISRRHLPSAYCIPPKPCNVVQCYGNLEAETEASTKASLLGRVIKQLLITIADSWNNWWLGL